MTGSEPRKRCLRCLLRRAPKKPKAETRWERQVPRGAYRSKPGTVRTPRAPNGAERVPGKGPRPNFIAPSARFYYPVSKCASLLEHSLACRPPPFARPLTRPNTLLDLVLTTATATAFHCSSLDLIDAETYESHVQGKRHLKRVAKFNGEKATTTPKEAGAVAARDGGPGTGSRRPPPVPKGESTAGRDPASRALWQPAPRRKWKTEKRSSATIAVPSSSAPVPGDSTKRTSQAARTAILRVASSPRYVLDRVQHAALPVSRLCVPTLLTAMSFAALSSPPPARCFVKASPDRGILRDRARAWHR